MKKTPIIFIVLLFCISIGVKSQTVLLNVDRENEPEYNKGPNTANFTHALFDFTPIEIQKSKTMKIIGVFFISFIFVSYI